jgi:hypothetical protein
VAMVAIELVKEGRLGRGHLKSRVWEGSVSATLDRADICTNNPI